MEEPAGAAEEPKEVRWLDGRWMTYRVCIWLVSNQGWAHAWMGSLLLCPNQASPVVLPAPPLPPLAPPLPADGGLLLLLLSRHRIILAPAAAPLLLLLRPLLLVLLPLRPRRHGRRRPRPAAVAAVALGLPVAAAAPAHAAAAADVGRHLGIGQRGGVFLFLYVPARAAARPLQVVVVPGALGSAPAPAVGAGRRADGLPLVDGRERGDGLGEEEDAPAPALCFI